MDHNTRVNMTKQEVIQSLKKQRCRITNQRRILLDIILEGECTSCKELYYKAIKKDPGIGVATVYRMVNILEEIGVIYRKKEYLVQHSSSNKIEHGKYQIILEDETSVELTDEMWREVIKNGLKCCGILNKNDMQVVQVKQF